MLDEYEFHSSRYSRFWRHVCSSLRTLCYRCNIEFLHLMLAKSELDTNVPSLDQVQSASAERIETPGRLRLFISQQEE